MLIAERAEISAFVDSIFRYADPGTFISLRAFDQKDRGKPPVLIQGVPVGDSLDDLINAAAAAAQRAANAPSPVVFAPPVATFRNAQSARYIDLANGVAISVELDSGDTRAAQARLEHLLGPCTTVMASGGQWISPDTGEVHDKLHLHWRLSEPTRTPDDHERLRLARQLAAQLVGGDPTAAPPVHPLRWPGSWNLKGKPRLAMIAGGNPAAEVHLIDALDRLQEAVELAGIAAQSEPHISGAQPTSDLARVAAAMAAIPNDDVHWDQWTRFGMALYRASGGSEAGLAIWRDWSAKSAKHEDGACQERWAHFATSPPTMIGAGTVFFHANQAGWTWQSEPPPDPDDPGYWAALVAQAPEPPPEPQREPPSKQSNDLPLLWFDDIEPSLDALDFVQGVLIEHSAAVVYGESNAGKTFWTTDLALHVAAGVSWNGKRVERGGVVYCVLEGGMGFRNRVAAWRRSKGLDGQRIPFAAIPASLNLLDPNADTPRLIKAVQAAAAQIDVPVKLVVIDTLSRALAGGNENSPEDMGALVRNMDLIREYTGAATLFVHHSGKDAAKGARGHSLLLAAIDTEIEVIAEEGTNAKQATIEKQRELRKGDVFPFTLEVIELGQNRHGESVTTCLVQTTEGDIEPIVRERRGRSNPNAMLGARALKIAIGKAGALLPETDEYPHRTVAVSGTIWRDEFYQLKGASPDNNRQAFNRAETALLADNTITARNGLVWFVRDQRDTLGA